MFEKLRRNAESKQLTMKKVTATVLFSAIAIVFVFLGLPSKFKGEGGASYAATVNNKLISIADLSQEEKRVEQMYAPFMQGGMTDSQRQQLRQKALEDLITAQVVAQTADQVGILSSDAEVFDVISKQIPAFQQDGRFSPNAYKAVLADNQMNPTDFEEKIREEKKSQRLSRVVQIATQVAPVELPFQKKLKEAQINLEFVKLDKKAWMDGQKVSAEDIKKNLENPDFKKKVESNFAVNKQEYQVEEEVRAQHILIKADPKDADANAKALAKIKEIQKSAQGQDFAKLATQFSEDGGSKAKGGDLGYFKHGQMTGEFEKAAFTLPVGKVSEPIKTPFGYHLIKVLDHKKAKSQELKDVEDKIASNLILAERFDKLSDQIEAALSKNDSKELDALLKAQNFKWEETGFYDLDQDHVPKINSAAVADAAADLTPEKPLLPRLVRDNSKYILKLKDTKTVVSTDGDDKLKDKLNQERFYANFESLIGQQNKRFKINVNGQVIRGERD